MATPSCKRCLQPAEDPDGVLLACPACGGPLEDSCDRCGKRETRGDELRRCIGCADWLCARPQCSRQGYENLALRQTGRVCAACFRRREIVLAHGSGKGAGSGAGVEAIERARYYLHETTVELDQRLRKLATELIERTEAAAKTSVREVEAATERQIGVAADKLGKALEEALARGVARGTTDLERSGRSLVGAAGSELKAVRLPLAVIALLVLVANGAITVGLVMALR
jgi:hypothetical protein